MSGELKVHDELADALLPIIESSGVRATYKWGPGAIKLPAAVIEPPTIKRTEPDEPEDRVGADNWRLNFPVVFYIELPRDTKAQETQAELIQLVVNFIRAIDTLQPDGDGFVLNGLCEDVKVVSAEPFSTPPAEEGSRTQLGYETHVSVLTFK
jgi:hypothetical protein